MASVLDVAKLLISLSSAADDDSGISNLKLQKLAYYAQGFHLALFDGQPLFDENIEAWTHGPVVPELYHHYKQFGKNPIEPESDAFTHELTEEQVNLIQEVHDVFGQFSAWKLRNMTHEEAPWLSHESDASVIPKHELFEYFKTRVH